MIYILISHFLLYDLGQRLDINRTRQILDSSWIQEHSAWALVTFSQYLDKIWTDIVQGQTLDITQIRWPTLGRTQGLDRLWTIMGYGQILG